MLLWGHTWTMLWKVIIVSGSGRARVGDVYGLFPKKSVYVMIILQLPFLLHSPPGSPDSAFRGTGVYRPHQQNSLAFCLCIGFPKERHRQEFVWRRKGVAGIHFPYEPPQPGRGWWYLIPFPQATAPIGCLLLLQGSLAGVSSSSQWSSGSSCHFFCH